MASLWRFDQEPPVPSTGTNDLAFGTRTANSSRSRATGVLESRKARSYVEVMTAKSFSDLLGLTPAERIPLAQNLWDSILEDSWLLALSKEQRRELERRLVAYEQGPTSARRHDQLRTRLQARFGA
jgi:putative addiction module component (TIGR02574 family)